MASLAQLLWVHRSGPLPAALAKICHGPTLPLPNDDLEVGASSFSVDVFAPVVDFQPPNSKPVSLPYVEVLTGLAGQRHCEEDAVRLTHRGREVLSPQNLAHCESTPGDPVVVAAMRDFWFVVPATGECLTTACALNMAVSSVHRELERLRPDRLVTVTKSATRGLIARMKPRERLLMEELDPGVPIELQTMPKVSVSVHLDGQPVRNFCVSSEATVSDLRVGARLVLLAPDGPVAPGSGSRDTASTASFWGR
jgi:hypothetical protein